MSENTIESEQPKSYTQEEVDALQQGWTVEREAIQQTLTSQQVEYAFYKKAAAAGIPSPDSLLSVINLSGVTADESGEFQGLDEIIQSLTAVVPRTTPRTIGGPNGSEQRTEKTKEQLIADAADKARRSGKAEDRAAFSALKQKLTN